MHFAHFYLYIQNLIMTTVYEMNLHAHVLVNQIIHITKSKEIKQKAPLLQSTADSSFSHTILQFISPDSVNLVSK